MFIFELTFEISYDPNWRNKSSCRYRISSQYHVLDQHEKYDRFHHLIDSNLHLVIGLWLEHKIISKIPHQHWTYGSQRIACENVTLLLLSASCAHSSSSAIQLHSIQFGSEFNLYLNYMYKHGAWGESAWVESDVIHKKVFISCIHYIFWLHMPYAEVYFYYIAQAIL